MRHNKHKIQLMDVVNALKEVCSESDCVRPKSYVVVRVTNRIRQDSLQHHTHLR